MKRSRFKLSSRFVRSEKKLKKREGEDMTVMRCGGRKKRHPQGNCHRRTRRNRECKEPKTREAKPKTKTISPQIRQCNTQSSKLSTEMQPKIFYLLEASTPQTPPSLHPNLPCLHGITRARRRGPGYSLHLHGCSNPHLLASVAISHSLREDMTRRGCSQRAMRWRRIGTVGSDRAVRGVSSRGCSGVLVVERVPFRCRHVASSSILVELLHGNSSWDGRDNGARGTREGFSQDVRVLGGGGGV